MEKIDVNPAQTLMEIFDAAVKNPIIRHRRIDNTTYQAIETAVALFSEPKYEGFLKEQYRNSNPDAETVTNANHLRNKLKSIMESSKELSTNEYAKAYLHSVKALRTLDKTKHVQTVEVEPQDFHAEKILNFILKISDKSLKACNDEQVSFALDAAKDLIENHQDFLFKTEDSDARHMDTLHDKIIKIYNKNKNSQHALENEIEHKRESMLIVDKLQSLDDKGLNQPSTQNLQIQTASIY